MDVQSLYNSILHIQGLAAIRYVLQLWGIREWKFNNLILQMLEFILHYNVFLFHGSHYLQLHSDGDMLFLILCQFVPGGVGAGFPPRWDPIDVYSPYLNMVEIHWRYLFFMWEGSEQLLKQCVERLNQNDSYLFFTLSYDLRKIDFLVVSRNQMDE